jgi:hypothetical protein
MERELSQRRCVDVSKCPRTATGDYVLVSFKPDCDYCDAVSEEWIQSIGKLKRPLPSVLADNTRVQLPTGTLLASTTPRHYSAGESEIVECVWLR